MYSRLGFTCNFESICSFRKGQRCDWYLRRHGSLMPVCCGLCFFSSSFFVTHIFQVNNKSVRGLKNLCITTCKQLGSVMLMGAWGRMHTHPQTHKDSQPRLIAHKK